VVGGGRRAVSTTPRPISAYQPIGRRSTWDVLDLLSPGRLGSKGPGATTMVWPKGLRKLLGDQMLSELNQLTTEGVPISKSGIEFLQKVAARYPKYKDTIKQILAVSGTAGGT